MIKKSGEEIEMKQQLTAKLKLNLSEEQKSSVRKVCLAYRDALHYSSQIAFENGKMSSSSKLQKLVYHDLRLNFGLGAQMACNVPRQVAASYKVQWTKLKQNKQFREKGYTKKRYKGLDNPLKFSSRTCTLNYNRDYSFKTEQRVSIITLSGRIIVSYSGYNKHLELIKNGGKIGAAKIYYNCSNKTYYLLVSIEVDIPDIKPENIFQVRGIDVGRRFLSVDAGIDNSCKFYSGKEIKHKASKYYQARKRLQRKGTRGAKRRLIALSGRERRFIADINHQISKKIAQPNRLIGLEDLTHVRERTKSKSGKRATKKQRKANRNKSKWSFAELHSFIDYKAILNNSLAIKIPANYSSQCCIKCGHVSKENRPNKGLLFHCQCCGYKLHADLIGARNMALRTLLIRQDWISKGCLSATLDVSDVEAKAKNLCRFLELRWSLDASPDLSR